MNVTSLLALTLLTAQSQSSEIRITGPTRITTSTRIAPGTYQVENSSQDGAGASVIIEGSGITVDFQNAVLRGSAETTEPDARAGVGILVKGRDITLKNINVHGFKVGLVGRDAPGLKILGGDFSYNWKQHLKSGRDKEDLSDWMSFHHNEDDEWLEYGGGIYLRDCDRFEVKGVTIVGGQSGLMMTNCDNGLVWNNNFSYLSALGIGMYRSSENRIMHNRIDYCVRGYSHGVYNRGQDSAGILIYEQSNKNVFAYNSVTHGGDGFFLWAGQSTMDTGQGGCNDNLLFGNDFSHAPTNGIEATFSRNTFVNNLMLECWHGVWGGYSYDSTFLANTFGFNAEGVALEHGQDNEFVANRFIRDRQAINIWMNATQDPNWGYPKNRDTKSRDYLIVDNLFEDIESFVFRLRDTANVTVTGNRFVRSPQGLQPGGELPNLEFTNNTVQASERNLIGMSDASARFVDDNSPLAAPTMQASGNVILSPNFDAFEYRSRFNIQWDPWARNWSLPTGLAEHLTPQRARELTAKVRNLGPAALEGGLDPFIRPNERRGRRTIIVDEWGPYDYQRPLLWPRLPITVSEDGKNQSQVFDILGPEGEWKIISHTNCEVSAMSGSVPTQITVTTSLENPANLLDIQLEYIGSKTVDYRGIVTPAGRSVRFGFRETFVPISWTVNHFTWEKDVSDPRTQADAFAARLAMTPVATYSTNRLDIAAGGSPRAGVPDNYWATVALGTVRAAPGRYLLKVTTDDGCKVWVNGELVIKDAWKYQGPTQYQANVTLKGDDEIRVEHFEIDGYSALKVELVPLD
ncbi:MAG: right-handed parallel beta-helix repeat-containing protein [Fimbriimonadaceae bacterium]|nr:right-handed parallel beta-helix repeat-containing protein [Fimbriimonadaceae bacterium]